MPTVPRIQSQVDNNLGPNIQVDTQGNRDAFGLGSATRELGNTIVDFAKSVKNNADNIAAMEAEDQLNKFEADYLYNPETGLFNKKGKDSFNAQNELEEKYNKLKADISNKLSNNEQKFMFEKIAIDKKNNLDRQTMRHIGAQIQEYDDQVTTSLLDSERNAAINSYQDPDRIVRSIERQKQAIVQYGDRHGLPTEMIQMKAQAAESGTHAGIISRMLANNDDLHAEAYYKANEANIIGQHKEQLEKELEIGLLRGKSQRFTDQIMSKGLDYQSALSLAGKQFENEPKLRDAVESRLDRAFSLKEKADRERQENLFKYASSQFDKDGNLDKLPPKLISAMNPETRRSLSNYVNANPVRDDGILYYKLRQLAENPKTRDKFKDYDLTKEFGNLSKDNRNKLIEIQESLRNGTGQADKELDGSLTDAQIMQDVFKSAGYDNEDDFAKFRQAVDAEILRTKQINNKFHLNNDEVRSIANKQASKVITSKGFIWDSKKPRFNLDINDIPSEDKKNIEDALRLNGKEVTDQAIMNLFLKKAKQSESK